MLESRYRVHEEDHVTTSACDDSLLSMNLKSEHAGDSHRVHHIESNH